MTPAWSDLAREELLALRRFAIGRWGSAVDVRYVEDVAEAAKRVGREPDRARRLESPYCPDRVRSHYLILHVDEAAACVTIARVLHVAMDIERHLP